MGQPRLKYLKITLLFLKFLILIFVNYIVLALAELALGVRLAGFNGVIEFFDIIKVSLTVLMKGKFLFLLKKMYMLVSDAASPLILWQHITE